MQQKTYTTKDGKFTGKLISWVPDKKEVTLMDIHSNVRHLKMEDVAGLDEKEATENKPKDTVAVKKEEKAKDTKSK